MIFCAAILSYGKVPRIKQVIEALSGLPIYVFNTTKSWWNEDQADDTGAMTKNLNVTIIRKEWNSQKEALNYAKKLCRELGYDVMLIFDTDEVVENLPGLLSYIESNHNSIGAYCAEMIDYDVNNTTILPRRGHCPIVAIKTDHSGIFYDKRCFRGDWTVVPNVFVHHFSLGNTEEYKYKIGNIRYGDDFPPPEFRGKI